SSLAALEAAVDGIRRLWRGERVDMAADGFAMSGAHLRFAARPDIPIYISASGPKTLELAGRIADGAIILVGLFPEALEWAISHLARGAESAGRPRPPAAVFAYGAVRDDEESAIDDARSIAAWFPQTAPHVCALAGLPSDVVARVRAAYGGGEFQEASAAASALPDEFVRKVALAGDRRYAAEQIQAAVRAGAGSVHSFPPRATRLTPSRR